MRSRRKDLGKYSKNNNGDEDGLDRERRVRSEDWSN